MSTHNTDSGPTASSDDSSPPPDEDRSSTPDDDRSSARPDSRPAPNATDRRSTTPTYPDATPVGSHLVIDRSEWIPGANPEPHLGHDGQQSYRESYYRCVKCGEERQAKRYFPDDCGGDPDPDSSDPDSSIRSDPDSSARTDSESSASPDS